MVGRTRAPHRDGGTRCRDAPAARSVRLPYALGVPRRRLASIALALLALVLVMGACAAPEPFDPTGPCSADGAAPGAYPELEALIPTMYEGRAPETLDS